MRRIMLTSPWCDRVARATNVISITLRARVGAMIPRLAAAACRSSMPAASFFFFQAEDGIRDFHVTGVQTCALPIFADIDVDASTSEVTLRVLVNNPKLTLLPGMFVRALITFGEDQNALLIPQQAVQRDASLGAQIFVVNDKDEIEVRPVTTGRVVDNQYLVLEGVEPGDRVVVEGHDKVRTGTKVVPTPWKRQASSTEEG